MTVTPLATALAACREVSVTHGTGRARVSALAAIDLEIAPAERLALWGPSGSGKTTLLHVLGGLVAPTSGEIVWRGGPLSQLDVAARTALRARGIAYVLQGINLLPYFTAYENVVFAAQASHPEDVDAERPLQLLTQVGLEHKYDALPDELSGGEAQRVAIARALAQRPELLLCDEPTGQLDSDTGRRVLDLIDALQAEHGFALAVATHDVDVAARYDRVVELHDGRVNGRVDR